MATLHLDGIDGSNPLHMLAALGAVLLTDDATAGQARMGWSRRSGRYSPCLVTSLEGEAWSKAIAARLRPMGQTQEGGDSKELERRLRDLKSAEKKLVERVKEADRAGRVEAKAKGLTKADARAHVSALTAPLDAELAKHRRAREEAESARAGSLGFGPAHLGDMIAVPPELFRSHARAALETDPATARQLSALASDACLIDSKVQPTPYSFSNGGSGKYLLKDFRSLAARVEADGIARSVLRGEPELEDVTSLCWDPRDLRSFAYQWEDPERAKAQTDRCLNALAYVGLGLVPAFPGPRGLAATAFAAKGFTWPIWEPLVSPKVIQALLSSLPASMMAEERASWSRRGVLAIYRAEVVNPTGKRNYFSASRAV